MQNGNLPPSIQSAICLEIGATPRVEWLCAQFLARAGFDGGWVRSLLSIGKGEHRDTWEARRLAAQLIEFELVRLRPKQLDEVGFLFVAFGIEDRSLFLNKSQRRLWPASRQRALPHLIHRSTQESKLVLGRHIFRPAETVNRILSLVGVSRGLPGMLDREGFDSREYERSILEALLDTQSIFWIGPETTSRVNSLVEHPIGAVALVVKPPGSDLEIEVKRAGMRGRCLGVLHSNQEGPVPITHRLQGGSPGWMLEGEADQAGAFRAIFNAVHGYNPPFSRMVAISNVDQIPGAKGNTHVLSYFQDSEEFGVGYEEMRAEMRKCVDEQLTAGQAFPDGLALTVQFLRDLKPRQSILIGTSSWRLDLLRQYLSAEGPEQYFTKGLGKGYTKDEARWFADDLLEEILGVYTPPKAANRTYREYVEAALRIPSNRTSADAAYLFCMGEVGRFWGTLLAVNGYTRGESFVERNVGLKSVWDRGRWRLRIVFMDHDCLACPFPEHSVFDAEMVVEGFKLDERHIMGELLRPMSVRGTALTLQDIYGTDPDKSLAGLTALRTEMKAAFDAVQLELTFESPLRKRLSEAMVTHLGNFKEIVRSSLQDSQEAWSEQAGAWPKEAQVKKFIHAIAKDREFFERYSFLYTREKVT